MRDERSRIPPDAVSYRTEARQHFCTGDVLCFRGRGPLSWAIRRLTDSRYSHVGLVYLFEERVYCLEAVGGGVRLVLMSQLVRRYAGGIDYFEVEADEGVRRQVLSFSFCQLGKLYDTAGLLRFLWVILTGNAESARRDDQWFCSELVAAAFQEAQRPLVDRAAAYTSPSDLVRSEALRFRYTLKA